MADEHRENPGVVRQHGFDDEIDYKSIIRFVVGLIATALVVLAVMWEMGVVFKKAEEAEDRPPSPLAEALVDPIPPGPRLQTAPPRDMDALRAQDREALTTYGWVDRSGGVARIPIDRAKVILVERGLGAASDKRKEVK